MQEETHPMSFNDIFKSSFLESVTEFSLIDTVLGLAAALVIGVMRDLLTRAVAYRVELDQVI